MFASLIAGLPIALLPALHPQIPHDCRLEILSPQAMEEPALTDFNARIEEYIALRRQLARETPVPFPADDEGLGREHLRASLVAARPGAHEGAFFTPRMARVLIKRIDRALVHGIPSTPLPPGRPFPPGPRTGIHRAFFGASASIEWPLLARQFPELPAELDYAFWGRDLVLVDSAANLVIDVLRDALPEGAYPGVKYQ